MFAFPKLILALLVVICGKGIHGLVRDYRRTMTRGRTTLLRLSEKLVVAGDEEEVENNVSVSINNGVPTTGYSSMPTPPTQENKINGYSMPLGQKQFGYSTSLKRNNPVWLPKILFSRGETLETNYYQDDEQAEMEEDGYAGLQRTKKRSIFKRAVRLPLKLTNKLWPKRNAEPGTLILVRHGESEWNVNKTFTGWADPDLTEKGIREVEHAARLLMEGGYEIDVVFTSRLKRAIRSVWILLQEINETYLPVFKSWRMNERMYGALTG